MPRPAVQTLFVEAVRQHRAGRLAEAERLYRQILMVDARHADSLHHLGVIAHQTGRHAAAIDLIGQAIGLRDDVPFYHNNLGLALRDQGKPSDAVAHYERALALMPDYAMAHNNLANALKDQGRLADAVAHYERALALKPDFALAHYNLSNVLRDQGKLADAVAHYGRALALKPDFAEAHCNLGNALRDQGKLADAVAHYERALAFKPDYAMAHYNLGTALHDLGRFEEAQSACERAIELMPTSGRHYRALVSMRRVVTGDRYLAAMEKLAQDMPSLPMEDQKELHFALGKAYADLSQHEGSFRHFLEGNALKRREFVYDEPAALELFDRIRAVFNVDLMHSKRGHGDISTAPIFIVGMPRSGTTLIEQILATHPQVFGAGELEHFAKTVVSLSTQNRTSPPFPEMVPALSGEKLRQLGASYLGAVGTAASGALRFTDKMPQNFFYAGLIHLALPNARIIHMRRHPIDTCLSCFTQLFRFDHPYSYDLGELGRFYRAYETLMEHWRHVLPTGVMLEVQYEDVVADVKRQARRVVAHCGLEWDDACLTFYQTQRPIRTASAIQVRQPIYGTSVGRWRPYKNLLQPLIKELALADEVDAGGTANSGLA